MAVVDIGSGEAGRSTLKDLVNCNAATGGVIAGVAGLSLSPSLFCLSSKLHLWMNCLYVSSLRCDRLGIAILFAGLQRVDQVMRAVVEGEISSTVSQPGEISAHMASQPGRDFSSILGHS